jgi:short-subunit dehydrogenase
MKREGKRVVITGASSGIGAATAEAFARRGARLVLAARDAVALEAVAEKCRCVGGEAEAVLTDVTDAAAVHRLAERARERLGGIDLWFSNVGIGAVGRFEEVPIEAHRRIVEANLIGHINDAHAVLPVFKAQGRGIYVNMISVGGFAAAPMAAAYSASKFGLRGFSQALRAELTGWPDIHVCDLYPTLVDTPAFHHSGNFTGRAVTVTSLSLDPRDVAEAVVRLAERPRKATSVGAPLLAMKLGQFLAPDLTAAITGAVIRLGLGELGSKPVTAGNLFQPPGETGRVDGGFRRDGARRSLRFAAFAGALILGLGTIALVSRRSAQA